MLELSVVLDTKELAACPESVELLAPLESRERRSAPKLITNRFTCIIRKHFQSWGAYTNAHFFCLFCFSYRESLDTEDPTATLEEMVPVYVLTRSSISSLSKRRPSLPFSQSRAVLLRIFSD